MVQELIGLRALGEYVLNNSAFGMSSVAPYKVNMQKIRRSWVGGVLVFCYLHFLSLKE